MVPTGLPTKYKNKRLTLEQRLANLLNIYGLPNSYKWTFTYLDYYQTKSLYSLINLIKLDTDYASAYCCAALAVSIGRPVDKELRDLRLLYPQVNFESLVESYKGIVGDLPPLSELRPYFNLDSFQKLEQICRWFEFEPFVYPGLYMQQPLLLIDWLKEPYQSHFVNLSPDLFISRTLQKHASFASSVELNNLIKAIFYDRA